MKKVLFLSLPLITSFAMYAQEIDTKVEAEYAAAYKGLPGEEKLNLNKKSVKPENIGVLVLLDFSVDTLNKEEYSPKPKPIPKAHKVKAEDGLIAISDDIGDWEGYDHIYSMVPTWKDSFMIFGYTPTPFLISKYYDKGDAFFSFTLKFGSGKLYNSYFEEMSMDSTVKRYRNTATSKDLDKVEVPLKVENCYFSASPFAAKTVYGKAVLTTDAFYARNQNFKKKYIKKRYRMTVVFQSPVETH